jgi:two-component system response regulator HydG
MKRILIIDDDMDMCNLLGRFLQKKGYETEASHSGNKGLAKFKESRFDVVLCDFRLGDKEGREVLREIKQIDPYAIVIIITGYSDIKTAVDVIKSGAYDYITKPLIPEEVLNVIGRALQQSPDAAGEGPKPGGGPQVSRKPVKASDDEYLVGHAPATKELYRQIELVAPTNYSIILYGESGTGKEVIARTVHSNSARKDKPFIAMH